MYLKLMLAALSVGLLSSTTVPAQEAGSVVVKTIVNTLKNDAGQPISFPRGHLELTVLSFDIPVGARLPVHKHKGARAQTDDNGGLAQNLREHGGGAGSVLHEHGAKLNCPPRPRQAAVPAHRPPSAPSGPRCAYHPHG